MVKGARPEVQCFEWLSIISYGRNCKSKNLCRSYGMKVCTSHQYWDFSSHYYAFINSSSPSPWMGNPDSRGDDRNYQTGGFAEWLASHQHAPPLQLLGDADLPSHEESRALSGDEEFSSTQWHILNWQEYWHHTLPKRVLKTSGNSYLSSTSPFLPVLRGEKSQTAFSCSQLNLMQCSCF